MVFLVDRGTVPDIKGLHVLRVYRLQTPTRKSLLLSRDTLDKVSKVSVLSDSDWVLSLTLHWNAAWIKGILNILRWVGCVFTFL